jgi:prefoldin subunit 5
MARRTKQEMREEYLAKLAALDESEKETRAAAIERLTRKRETLVERRTKIDGQLSELDTEIAKLKAEDSDVPAEQG